MSDLVNIRLKTISLTNDEIKKRKLEYCIENIDEVHNYIVKQNSDRFLKKIESSKRKINNFETDLKFFNPEKIQKKIDEEKVYLEKLQKQYVEEFAYVNESESA